MLNHPDYRWIDAPEGSFLHFRSMCVALVRVNAGRCEVEIRSARVLYGRASSVEQGKRHIERWIAHRPHFPVLRRGKKSYTAPGGRPDRQAADCVALYGRQQRTRLAQ